MASTVDRCFLVKCMHRATAVVLTIMAKDAKEALEKALHKPLGRRALDLKVVGSRDRR